MNIEELITEMEKRPGMYVGTPSLEAVSQFISGFLYHAVSSGRATPIDSFFKEEFHSWVKARLEREHHLTFDQQRNYVFYIRQVFPEEDQLGAFFRLCHGFFEERSGGLL